MNEVTREFLLETHENLEQLDFDLVALEKEPSQREILARIFRTLHTIKGSAGFLGLMKLQAVAHAAENLLSRLTTGALTFNDVIADALLATVDAIKRMLAEVEKTEYDGDDEHVSLIRTLEQLRSASAEVPPAAPAVAHATPRNGDTPSRAAASPRPEPAPSRVVRKSPDETDLAPVAPAPVITVDIQGGREPVLPTAPGVSDSAVRVDVGLLDRLMTLVGELVLARNQVMRFSDAPHGNAFQSALKRLNFLTSEVQSSVMKTRLQPIGTLWSKFPRLVRDLAMTCGKQVRLVMEGHDTELDKTILEAIRDPLIHMIRNAIDHGIEPPVERKRLDKPPDGRLQLHAYHEGGNVIVTITDDGAGIDPERIRAKAQQAGLLAPAQAAQLNERRVLDLVFLPGFSTAETVTELSGRGVGMNVVRTDIEKVGGSVDIESRVGRGTTVRLRIPLTLAIIPALIVTSAGQSYAIPQLALLELLHLRGDAARRAMESIHGAPVYRLRGNLLPLVFLDSLLQVGPNGAPRSAEDGLAIVVVQADDQPFGIVVDAIQDTEEIVVKPLQRWLKGINVFTGATVRGDGSVALILDVGGVAQCSGVLSRGRARPAAENGSVHLPAGVHHALVLFSLADGRRMALPLAQVARLEEFPRSALERVGHGLVVQYRGEILPLLDLTEVLPAARADSQEFALTGDTVPTVVHAGVGRRVGLVVSRIIDIVAEPVNARAQATQPGILFTAVIRGKVTEVLNIDEILRPGLPALAYQPAED